MTVLSWRIMESICLIDGIKIKCVFHHIIVIIIDHVVLGQSSDGDNFTFGEKGGGKMLTNEIQMICSFSKC